MVKSGISPEYFHKYNRVDLLTETESGELVLIELQVGGQYDYFHRMLYGSSKLITDHMDAGLTVDEIEKLRGEV